MSMLRGGPVWLLLAGVAAQDRIVGGRLVTGEQRYDNPAFESWVLVCLSLLPKRKDLINSRFKFIIVRF